MPVKKRKIVKKTTKKVACKACGSEGVKKVKKLAKVSSLKPQQIKSKAVGKVIHYFSNIKVAVVKVVSPIKVGDSIRIVGGEDTDFKQKVASMEINHKKVKMVKKGKEAGMKEKEKVNEGYKR